MTTYSDVSLMIDGAWTKGANGRTIPVINPATEEVIGTVAHAEKADLDRALAAADKGFKQWRKVSSKIMTPDFQSTLYTLGWRYVSSKGKRGARFERIPRGYAQAA